MRVLLLAACLLLGGCDSIMRLDSDSFSMGSGDYDRFARDARLCNKAAGDRVSYDPVLQMGTHYARNRAFNRAYSDCMTGHGHAPRPYYKNWLPPVGAS